VAERVFIGVAWPYANGHLHLGHIAGCYLSADIFARYHRIKGNDVLMVSGSDQHGTPITLKAEQESVTPQEIVDRYHKSFLESWEALGITFDLFTTTGTDNHRATVQDIFLTLLEQGYIYKDTMSVFYSEQDGRYLPDRYVEGTCPHCNNGFARGDQCDNCGKLLSTQDLIKPRSRLSGSPIQIRDSEHFFLKLSSFQDRLLAWVREQSHWRPNVLHFTRNYVAEGLKDRAITRDIQWGVPVPVPGYEEKRIYVWFDAVVGYLSASKEWAMRSGDPNAWHRFWQDSQTRSYYFIGKDNIPFHTIIWPAMLMGKGSLNLPHDVPANEFLNVAGRQLSTSRNWAVWVPDYLERYPPDPLRYFLSAAMPETSDTDFSWHEFVRRNNDELVATYGNLVHRILTIVHRNFEGHVPPFTEDPSETLVHQLLRTQAETALVNVGKSIGKCHFREALGHAMGLAAEVNRYLDRRAPWKQVREDLDAAARTMYTSLYALSALSVMLYPFLPFSSQKLHELLGRSGSISDLGWNLVAPITGTPIPKPEALFTKLDDEIAELELRRMGASV
jgi:methionyl-tRNA synthetase